MFTRSRIAALLSVSATGLLGYVAATGQLNLC